MLMPKIGFVVPCGTAVVLNREGDVMSWGDCDLGIGEGQVTKDHGGCIKMAGHEGRHKDSSGKEWGEPPMSDKVEIVERWREMYDATKTDQPSFAQCIRELSAAEARLKVLTQTLKSIRSTAVMYLPLSQQPAVKDYIDAALGEGEEP
jgi:hypothetical protein